MPSMMPNELSRIADSLAEFAGPLQDRPDLGRGVTADRDVRRAQRGEELQFAAIALGRFIERVEQGEAFRQVADRLDVRRAFLRPQAGLQPVSDRLLGQARFGEMVRDQLRPRLDGLRESGLECGGGAPVEFLPFAS